MSNVSTVSTVVKVQRKQTGPKK